jgi:hypothetical protein
VVITNFEKVMDLKKSRGSYECFKWKKYQEMHLRKCPGLRFESWHQGFWCLCDRVAATIEAALSKPWIEVKSRLFLYTWEI